MGVVHSFKWEATKAGGILSIRGDAAGIAPDGLYRALPCGYAHCTKSEEIMRLKPVMLFAALALPVMQGAVWAPAWAQPAQKALQIYVPFAPGGSADGSGRWCILVSSSTTPVS